jgi:cytidylate kinase
MRTRARGEQQIVARHAEKLMRQWVLGLEVDRSMGREQATRRLVGKIPPYVTISREAGAGGRELARMVAETLGWECMDRQLLDFMAEKYHLPHGALEIVDEQKRNWIRDVLGPWLDKTVVPQTEYVAHLGQMVLLAARNASAVFLGRGAQFYLPPEKGLRVRLIAPYEQCIERAMQREGFGRDLAKKWVSETNQGRRQFVQRYFHRDATDPKLYDLVINLEHMDLEEATQLTVQAFRNRFGPSQFSRTVQRATA